MNPSQTLGGGLPPEPLADVSASDLIVDALGDLGVLRAGSRPSPEMMDEGFRRLNRLLDSFSADGVYVPTVVREPYSLTAGQREYTLGPGGDLDSNRPLRIVRAVLVDANGGESETEFESDGSWPLLTITLPFDPVSGQQLVIYSQGSLARFGDLDTKASFPAGYALALQLKLALILAPRCALHTKIPRPLIANIAIEAEEALTRIRRANLIVPDLAPNPDIQPRLPWSAC